MENPNLDLQECDWEVVLPNSEENIHHSSSGGGGGGAGVICSDYFSIDDSAAVTSAVSAAEVGGDGGESDNPNLVDPIAPLRSSPEDSDTDFDSSTRNSIPLQFDSGAGLGFDQSSFSDNTVVNNDVEEDDDQFSGLNSEDEEEKKSEDENENENENEDENEKKVVVWWKVPMEVLKYCVWRVSPVWSVSMAAAALLGFVLLRRRYLYKMKRKSQDINVSVVDNKVSQLMSRAARLNEAFSVVKRIPVIRPALPAPGMTSWPVMSLR